MTRALTPEEEALLRHRKELFPQFLEDRMPALVYFMHDLGIPDGAKVLTNAPDFVAPLENFLRDQEITEDNRNWIVTIVGYFIGEYIAQQYGGAWLVNEAPESRTFARFVVGDLQPPAKPLVVDPIAVASAYMAQPPGRSLSAFLEKLDGSLV